MRQTIKSIIKRLVLFSSAPRVRVLAAGSKDDRILVIMLTHLGDCLLARPLLESILGRYPKVDLVLKPGMNPLFESLANEHPDMNLIEFSCPWVGSCGWAIGLKKWAELVIRLRRTRYDLAIVTHAHMFSSITARLASLYSIGITDGTERVLDQEIDQSKIEGHVVGRFCELAKSLSVEKPSEVRVSRLSTDGTVEQAIAERIRSWRRAKCSPSAVLVCVHPGAGGVAKRWPVRNFAEAVNSLNEVQDVGVVLLAGSSEKLTAMDFRKALKPGIPLFDLVGQTSLSEMVGAVQAIDVYLGNDSGATHLSAAAGAKTIALFGPASNVEKWQPQGENVWVRSIAPADFYNTNAVHDVASDLIWLSRKVN
jgi:ADP-heptose:LPS heptosyltransferase